MQRFALFASLLLCLSSPSFAKLNVKIAVVTNDKDASVETALQEGMEATRLSKLGFEIG